MNHTLGETILAALSTFDQALNDPLGDGSGDGANPPDGDSYNSAMEIIRTIVADHRPTPADAASDLAILLLQNPALEKALIYAAWIEGLDAPLGKAITALKISSLSRGAASAPVQV